MSWIDTFNKGKPIVVLVGGFIVTGVSGTWFLSAQLARYESRLESVELAVKEDRYTLTMASEKALRTAIENPGMRVPDPREPSKIIVVEIPKE